MHHHGRSQEPHVADAVRRKRAECGLNCIGSLVKKSDQERRGNPEEFPASKKHVDATGEHHEVHAGAKQSQQHEKPCEPRLAMQILPGKGIDQCAQTR